VGDRHGVRQVVDHAYRNQFVMPAQQESDPGYAQYWYGTLFDELQARGISSVIVFDGGVRHNIDYNPMLEFYADIARTKGLEVEMIPLNQTIPVGKLVRSKIASLVETPSRILPSWPNALLYFWN
jgi:hypothetical protein